MTDESDINIYPLINGCKRQLERVQSAMWLSYGNRDVLRLKDLEVGLLSLAPWQQSAEVAEPTECATGCGVVSGLEHGLCTGCRMAARSAGWVPASDVESAVRAVVPAVKCCCAAPVPGQRVRDIPLCLPCAAANILAVLRSPRHE